MGFCLRQEYVVEKRCSRCGEVKSITEFHKQIASPDGLAGWCKACVRIYQKVYREGHREKMAAKQRVYYKRHRAKVATYQKMYQDKHREKIAARKKAHYKEHREKIAAKQKVYQEEHLEQFRTYNMQRRARITGASGHVTVEQIQARWDYYGNKCYICGKDAEATDHVIPLSKGGNNWPANLRPICERCNSVKSGRWPYDFKQAKQEKETTY